MALFAGTGGATLEPTTEEHMAMGTPLRPIHDGDRRASPPGYDPDRRLRGEPLLDAAMPEQAHRWAETYAAMVRFAEDLLGTAEGHLASVTDETARHLLTDIEIRRLETTCRRVRRRCDLWRSRAREPMPASR